MIDKYVEKLPAAEKAAMEKEFADIEDKREKEWEEFKAWREANKRAD